MSMHMLRFRIRTLMMAVGVVAALIWGAMMGIRSYDYFKQARFYASQERGWRIMAARGDEKEAFRRECAAYFRDLTRKYRRAMWHPWLPVAPDPYAPGHPERH